VKVPRNPLKTAASLIEMSPLHRDR
jgi:hypothetical protein